MSYFRSFGGMVWPAPGERLSEVSWLLRYRNMTEPSKTPPDDLVAASVIDAYQELVRMPSRQRERIIRELRKGPGVELPS